MKKIKAILTHIKGSPVTSKKEQCNIHNVVCSRPFEKHYNEMTRRERREYKRWLDKHNMWDGAIVSENMEKGKWY